MKKSIVDMHDQVLSQTIANIRHRLSDKYAKGEIDAFVRIIFRQLMRYEPVDILLHKDSVLSGFIVGKIDKVVDELLKNKILLKCIVSAGLIGVVFMEPTWLYGHR